uniref:DEP domain-containing protein n=1 Tax=Hucho hucho TaxID=62062 RepID=A0A4W5PJX4_9TELE
MEVPAAMFQHLVESFPRGVEAVIAAKGGPTVQVPLGHRLGAPVPLRKPWCVCINTVCACVCVSRRSYVGVELVQWLCEQCVYVRCRSMAVRVWQVLLELGILLSVDQRVVFGDSNSYYQFSFEECESAACEFCGLEKEAWPEAVRLLLQLVPYVQFRTGSEEDSEGNRDVCGDSFLQMKALERLTSTVCVCCRDSPPLCLVCVRPDGVCGREELTRLELVQRLAKDGCRLLQNQNYRCLQCACLCACVCGGGGYICVCGGVYVWLWILRTCRTLPFLSSPLRTSASYL